MKVFSKLTSTIKQYDVFTLLFVAAMFTKVLGFLPAIPALVVYLTVLIYAVYCIFKSRKVDKLFACLLIFIPIGILIAQPSPIFRSMPRYMLFALIMVCVSPLFQSKFLREKREKILMLTLWLCVLIGLGSFIGSFFDINYQSSFDNQKYTLDTVGRFGGLTFHSMLLGPVAGVGAVFASYIAYSKKNRLMWIVAICCLLCVLLSASRSALLASVIGIVIMLYKLTRGKGRFFKTVFLISVLGVLSFPVWEHYANIVIEKQEANEEMGGTFSSRENKWRNRLEEFESSPIVGIGFVALNPKHFDEYEPTTGVIEPGSSWLAVLSMEGIIGCIIIFMIFKRAIKSIIKSVEPHDALLLGVLSLHCVHMFAEGHIFSGGSFLCFLVWISVATCYDRKMVKS